MPPPPITGRVRILLNLLAVTVVVRLLRIDDLSLWVDEGVTWRNSTHGGWTDTVFAESNHPPVWWLVTRLFAGFGPMNERTLRLPAAICGMVAVLLTFFLVRRLTDPARTPRRGGIAGMDRDAAFWVVGLAAVNPFWIEYAQEARMYAAVLAESLGLSLLYLRWLDRGGRGTLVAYGVLASLALHTQYFAVWPIAAHAVHALLLARRTRGDAEPVRVGGFLVAVTVAGLSFVPWAIYMISAYHGISTGVYDPFGRMAHAIWRMGIGPALVALDRPRVEAGPAAVFAQEPVLVVVSALLWVVPIVLGVRALGRDRGARAFVLAAVLVPVVLVLAIFPKFPLIHEKYVIFLAPFLLLLAVLGARSARGVLRHVLLGGLVALHVAGFVAYHAGDAPAVERLLGSGHPYGKEQWREAYAWVARRARKGDVVLLHAPFTKDTWDFYELAYGQRGIRPAGQPVPPVDLPSDRALAAADLLARFPALSTASRVFLVLSHESTDERDHYRDVLLEALHEAWGGWQVDEDSERAFPQQWGIRAFQFVRP